MTLAEHVARAQATYITQLVQETETITEAARRAGVNRTYLYRLMWRHGLEFPKRRHVGAWQMQGL